MKKNEHKNEQKSPIRKKKSLAAKKDLGWDQGSRFYVLY